MKTNVDFEENDDDEQDSAGVPIWDAHRQLVANLVAVLEEIGDRVAAYGFNSQGRKHVRFLRIKDFDEKRGFRRYFWKAVPA